jgi:hypothetical protein
MTSEDKPKSGFSVREWLLASFAGIGLIISLATTWLATFRTVDEVRIVFNTLPSVTHIPGAVSISPNMKMTFINSGNRNVVLLGAVLRIIEDEATCEKVHWDQASVTLDMEPFILKASEIVIKEGKFKVHTDPSALISIDANGNSIYDWKFGSQANAATKEKDHHASVCI